MSSDTIRIRNGEEIERQRLESIIRESIDNLPEDPLVIS